LRTGKNPAKNGLPAYSPQRLGVALIVYIPFTEGYFENALEVFQYQVASLRATTNEPFDLLVFDNGSCAPAVSVLKGLHDRKQIDWLVLSGHNMGKSGAWNWIFAAMPNELVCYADSDVLFRPGWLEASSQVLEAFPQAGMVGAQPSFYDVMKGEGKAHLNMLEDSRYIAAEYKPPVEIVDEYVLGIGATGEVADQFYHTALPTLVQQEKGVQAVLGASHMQFVIPRQVARQVVPLPATRGLLRAETMSLDYKIDQLGYLHLSTTQPYVFHMGNTISERLLDEVKAITGVVSSRPVSPQRGQARTSVRASALERWLARLAKRPRYQKLLVRLYNLLFRALYAETLEK
jgi:glycosyltransferase involved in cell wall biosynthesis